MRNPFLSAECFPVPDRRRALSAFKSNVEKYARRNSPSELNVTVSDLPLGTDARFDGFFTLNGIRMMLKGRAVLGDRSILYMKAAQPANIPLSAQIDLFLSSVSRSHASGPAASPRTAPIAGSGASLGTPAEQNGHRIFSSPEHRFMLQYPENWHPQESPYKGIKFKLVDEGGASIAFQVEHPPGYDAVAALQFQALRAKSFADGQGGMDQVLAGASLVEHGPTEIANLPAYFSLHDLPKNSLGERFMIRQFQVQAASAGRLYIITLSAQAGCYPQVFDDFRKIMQSFVILKGDIHLPQ